MKLRSNLQKLIAVIFTLGVFSACEDDFDALYEDDVPVDGRILDLCVSEGGQGHSSADFGVTGLTIVNADNGEPLRELKNGDIVDLGEYGDRLSIRAETTGDTASVRFALDKEPKFYTDSKIPFYIQGDSKGKHGHCGKKGKHHSKDKKCYVPKTWTPELGFHTLTVIGFDKDKGKGGSGKIREVQVPGSQRERDGSH